MAHNTGQKLVEQVQIIRHTAKSDKEAILKIIKDSEQFDEDGLRYVSDTLENHLNNGSNAFWLTANEGEPVGVAYCVPEPVTMGTWNLHMLWVRKDREGHGHGAVLMNEVENILNGCSARLLVVETSGTPAFETARSFYRKCGFEQEGCIRNFFAESDDNLVYTKPICGT